MRQLFFARLRGWGHTERNVFLRQVVHPIEDDGERPDAVPEPFGEGAPANATSGDHGSYGSPFPPDTGSHFKDCDRFAVAALDGQPVQVAGRHYQFPEDGAHDR
jgi:hypothetical protein